MTLLVPNVSISQISAKNATTDTNYQVTTAKNALMDAHPALILLMYVRNASMTIE